MSKIKKPRNKKYHPRPVKPTYYGPAWLERQQQLLDKANLLVELTLPAGNLTDDDVDLLEDTLNWSLGILHHRYKNLNQQELDDVEPIVLGGRRSLNDIIDRKNAGTTSAYIARGDEIQIVSECFSIIVPLVKEALHMGPRTAMKEFNWAVQTAFRKRSEEQKAKKNKESK